MAILKQSTQDLELAKILSKMDEKDFVQRFAEDPHAAFVASGIEMSLVEFTAKLSTDNGLYEFVVKKISEHVDVSHLSVAASSCCHTPG